MLFGWISSKTILYVEIFRFQASMEDLSRMSQPMTWNASPWRQRSTGLTGLQGHLNSLAMLNFPPCLILISNLSISALGEANTGYSPCPLCKLVVLMHMSDLEANPPMRIGWRTFHSFFGLASNKLSTGEAVVAVMTPEYVGSIMSNHWFDMPSSEPVWLISIPEQEHLSVVTVAMLVSTHICWGRILPKLLLMLPC